MLVNHNSVNQISAAYPPLYVKPSSRECIAGEVVTLRNPRGAWRLVIVKDGRKARFSRGWNKFSDDNELDED